MAGLTNELAQVSEELEKVKGTMADRGENIADASPLNNIKGSIDKLNKEVRPVSPHCALILCLYISASASALFHLTGCSLCICAHSPPRPGIIHVSTVTLSDVPPPSTVT